MNQETFLKEYYSVYLKKATIDFILVTLFDLTPYKSNCIYQSMNKNFNEYLRKNRLVNPRIKAVPKSFATQYLDLLGLTEKVILDKSKEYFHGNPIHD